MIRLSSDILRFANVVSSRHSRFCVVPAGHCVRCRKYILAASGYCKHCGLRGRSPDDSGGVLSWSEATKPYGGRP